MKYGFRWGLISDIINSQVMQFGVWVNEKILEEKWIRLQRF